jgi:hypothetical protein
MEDLDIEVQVIKNVVVPQKEIRAHVVRKGQKVNRELRAKREKLAQRGKKGKCLI